MSGYIGKGKSVVNVESYTKTQANATFLTPTGDGSGLTGVSSSLATLTDCTVSTADPAIDSNPTSGLGHMWINKTSGEQYLLTDATAGANFWTNVGNGTGSIPLPNNYIAATGGTITTDGNFKVHTFTSSGTFGVTATPGSDALTVEYLVIAGGGGAGFADTGAVAAGGGGGAGGYRSSVVGQYSGGGATAETVFTVSVSSYTVTVGAGGLGTTTDNTPGTQGSNSVFGTVTSLGGGRGGGNTSGTAPTSGGSGGGGNESDGAGASGTSGQGYAGGNGTEAGDRGGGGGGAGSAGSGAAGGASVSSNITGSAVSRGQGGTVIFASSGGSGQGGANTGSGGGGNGTSGSAGGSGIVVIRYQFQAA